MKDKNTITFILKKISDLVGIPARLYKNNELVEFYSRVKLIKDPLNVYLNEVLSIKDEVNYYISKNLSYYGIINFEDYKVVLGPSRATYLTESELDNICKDLNLNFKDKEPLRKTIDYIPKIPLKNMMQIIVLLNVYYNDNLIELDEIINNKINKDELNLKIEKKIEKDKIDGHDYDFITNINFNSLINEQKVITYVCSGDSDAFKEWKNKSLSIFPPTSNRHQIYQIKVKIITYLTIVSRATINEGLDANESTKIFNEYSIKIEEINDISKLSNILLEAFMVYADKMRGIKYGNNPNGFVLKITNYIHQHISEELKVEDIAKALFMSRPYLSSKFIKDAGMSLNEYINKIKIDEAKRLLTYTTNPIYSISSYLGFSSQSYFTTIFKKYTHMNPLEYKEMNRKY